MQRFIYGLPITRVRGLGGSTMHYEYVINKHRFTIKSLRPAMHNGEWEVTEHGANDTRITVSSTYAEAIASLETCAIKYVDGISEVKYREIWSGMASYPRVHLYQDNDIWRSSLCGRDISANTARTGERGSYHPEYVKYCPTCARRAVTYVYTGLPTQ